MSNNNMAKDVGFWLSVNKTEETTAEVALVTVQIIQQAIVAQFKQFE